MSEHEHDHHHGLSHDLPGIIERGFGRRGVLSILGGLGAVTVVGCATQDDGLSNVTNTDTPTGGPGSPPNGAPPAGQSSTTVADGEIPEETGGPYPADGSNGVNVLTESGVVRKDITTSFGTASAVAAGVPLTIRLKVLDVNGDEATPYEGAAVYLWHCDRDGNYSMYSEAIVNENYLRGVQEAGADGSLEFTSIFPAAYSGRWPHIHFEVYPTLADATSASNRLRTSQLALPEAVCLDVYENAEGYEQSVTNVSQTSLATDNVFSDGYSLQMAKVTGSVEDGYVATLNVPV
jgi:protocatechuate 3,4-dioxygenase beta subunit